MSKEEEQQSREELVERFKALSEEEKDEFKKELFEGILFGPSDEAFVIYFDSQSRVKGLRAPATGAYADYASTGEYFPATEAEDVQSTDDG